MEVTIEKLVDKQDVKSTEIKPIDLLSAIISFNELVK